MSFQFHIFGDAVEARFRALQIDDLFVVDASELFEKYLSFFPEGWNPLYKERTEHDCSCCKHFVRNIGHVVRIDFACPGQIETVWDIEGMPEPYQTVADRMAEYVRSLPIRSVFRTKEGKFGDKQTRQLDEGRTLTWNHFWCEVPRKNRTDSPEEARGQINQQVQLFKRGLDTITAEALEAIVELIHTNSIYRGEEKKRIVHSFYTLHRFYHGMETAREKELFAWVQAKPDVAGFRNDVIGTLAVNLSEGMALDVAVGKYEAMVAPHNYKRPTALITQKMVDEAAKKLADLGLESALERRFARLDDVSVNNVLFVDNAVRPVMKNGGIGALLADDIKTKKVSVEGATAIKIDDFLNEVVPKAQSIDLLVENKHAGNFMSLTAPVDPLAGRLFKWDNNFAWSYDGEVADSVKARVKRAGGNISATMRVSLAWYNYDDLDIHCQAPGYGHIYFGDKCGVLDVDMNAYGLRSREPVENLAFTGALRNGDYKVWVNQFNCREHKDTGFEIEIEHAGQLRRFSYPKRVVGDIQCFTIKVANGTISEVEVQNHLIAGNAEQDKWGVKTETLVPVDTLMASPNHWDGQATGNKHWFFMLKGCKNPEPVRGIYNEFLKGELEPHRKVFELLGARTKCPPADKQLSGIGFSSTRKDQATVVVKGQTINRAYQIHF